MWLCNLQFVDKTSYISMAALAPDLLPNKSRYCIWTSSVIYVWQFVFPTYYQICPVIALNLKYSMNENIIKTFRQHNLYSIKILKAMVMSTCCVVKYTDYI
jgi:hypothetical protein